MSPNLYKIFFLILRMNFASLLCLILTIFAFKGIRAINHPSTSRSGNLDAEHHQYELRDCRTKTECTPCTFNQLTQIKECKINGDIKEEVCSRVNTNNPQDITQQSVYKACEAEGIAKYSIYIFIVVLIILLQVFFVILTKYRKMLEMNMYKRLSINKPSM
jgi:hypothetical protein